MANENHIVVIGNLADDPELRFTNNGTCVASFRVAVTPRLQEGGIWRDGDTSFFRVSARRDQASHLSESLRKGDRVLVVGRLRQRSWETPDGDRRSGAKIEADDVGASLKWATVSVEGATTRSGE
jgi:single-strand DNA-binding protein